MRYEDRIVDDVRVATDIVDLIQQYMPLKRAGRNFKAVCPFHQEKTPSFMVNLEKQIFHCFGCGVGGDVFSFLMRYENMTFPEALRLLAERARIALPQQLVKKEEGPTDTERLYEIYRLAVEYYHAHLIRTEQGRTAIRYLRKRAFPDEIINQFKLGWAPTEWRGLFDYLSKKGFSESILLKSSLILKSPQGRCFDCFRGRLLFPIHNLQGKVVGFGGRLIDGGDGPKYLNSPENPIFRKRRELFGLHFAKKSINRAKPQIIVVEGYMDFFRLYGAGFKSSVATLGTALTSEHVQALKRFSNEAIVIYDGDQAGETASLRGLEVFLEEGMPVKLVRMPPKCDPDDFVHSKGANAFQQLLNEAQDFFDYKLKIAVQRYNIEDSVGLMEVTNGFLETLAKIRNPILLEYYVRRLSNALHLDENTLRAELAKLAKRIGEREGRSYPIAFAKGKKEYGSTVCEETMLVALMVEDSKLCSRASNELSEIFFKNSWLREIFCMVSPMGSNTEANRRTRVLNYLRDEEIKRELAEIFSFDWKAEDRQKAFEDCLRKIKKQHVERKLQQLRRDIARAEQEGDQASVGSFMKEYQSLLRQVR